MPTSSMTEPVSTGLTFAVPDLHGRLDLLEAALAAIASHASGIPAEHTVVFLGDYVDRGPNSAQVLSRLMAGAPPGWRWICLKGNHEAMMTLALRNPDRLDWWIDNGGNTTILSYRDDRAVIAAHLAWIDALPAIQVDAHRVYVHAGVDRAMPITAQTEKILLWKRYPRDVDEGYGDRHLVHGHDPNIDGPLRLAHRTDLDTWAWRTGRLVVGVFDDSRPGGPIDLIEVTGEPAAT
jgi:serine/threonine protein phosphatase 1